MSSLLKTLKGKISETIPTIFENNSGQCSCGKVSTPSDSQQPFDSYVYQPLCTPLSTRLFQLLPGTGDEPIRGTLHHVSLAGNLPLHFIALSYTWGNGRRHHLIKCGRDTQLAVTCNLHSALVRLRKPQDDILLFADCICIDQATDERALHERAAQVVMMARIFGGASTVVVDLGDQSDNSDAVVDLLEHFANIADEQWDGAVEDPHRVIDLGIPSLEESIWDDFSTFCRRRWFERLWVVQEFALASDLLVMVGDRCFSDKLLFGAVHRALVVCGLANLHREDLLKLKDAALDCPLRVSDAAAPSAIRMQRTTLLRTYCQNVGAKPLSLGELMQTTKQFNTIDLRDKVYALLGMLNLKHGATFMVDYNESIPDLSKRLTRSLIESGEFPQLLNYHAAFDSSPASSWMIDLNIDSNADRITREANWKWLDNYQNPLSDHFQACGQTEAIFRRPLHENLIIVSGSFMGGIMGISEEFPRDQKRWYVSADVASYTEILKFTRWDHKTKKLVLDHLKGLSELDGVELYRTTLVANGAYNNDASKAWAWPKIADNLKQYVEAFEKIMNFVSLSKLPKLLPEMLAIIDSPVMDGSLMKMVTYYAVHMAANCQGRRVCVTEKNMVGLVPGDAEAGDVIAILLGCPLPFVLRKRGEHFRLIGTAYIHGVMHGEALELAEWELEGIVLC